jgi:demethoxyubiquinone hydroxylase (CLK1/Coq7/Cat5 family)
MITDRLVIEFDKALRTLFAPAQTTREVPGSKEPEAELSDRERAHASALMRINHVGEVCAQALYQGQALSCVIRPFGKHWRRPQTRKPNIWPGPSAALLNSADAPAC